MLLRARLLLGLLAVVAAGLLVADSATYTFLRGYLIDRVTAS